jgi:superkiller protein 3
LRVLIVTEKAFEIQQLRGYFEKSPYKIYDKDHRLDFYDAGTGKAGIDKFEADYKKEFFYDIIIISQKMKAFTGLQTAQTLAQKKSLTVPPIIIITEFIDKNLTDSGTKAGVVAFLKVPYNIDAFKDTLTNAANLMTTRLEKNHDYAIQQIEAKGATANIGEFRKKISQNTIAELNKVRDLVPWCKKPYMVLSRVLMEAGDFKTPLPFLRCVIRIDFTDQMPHKMLKTCYRKTGMHKEEFSELKKMLAANPKSAEVNAKVGDALLQTGNYTKAADFFRKAISNHKPTDSRRIKAKSHWGIGKSILATKDDKESTEKAKDELNRAINVDPTLVLAYFNLISVYKKLGMEKEAQEAMKIAVKIVPTNAQDWMDLFFFYLGDGDPVKAKFALGKATAIEPENPLSFLLAGEAFMRQRMFEEAAEFFEKSINIYPSDIKAYNALGICYRHLKQPKKSVEQYQKALQIDPKDFNVHYNLGKVLILLKEFKSAKVSFGSALKYKPDLKEAEEALAQIEKEV